MDGDFNENIVLAEDTIYTLRGGWDGDFASRSGTCRFDRLELGAGTMILDGLENK